MKTLITTLVLSLLAANTLAAPEPQIYVNQNLGFNVEGYKYTQAEFPCDIDKHLVNYLVKRSKKEGLRMEAVSSAEKIQNGVVPVLAIDIEQLVLGSEEHTYGTKPHSTLPKVQVTAAVFKGKEFTSAKHTCAIATLNEFTPTSNILDLGTVATVCSATRKCLKDLSKDIVEWVVPQIKPNK